MTLIEFVGCTCLAFGPSFAMFVITIARDPLRVILMVASSFFWLVSLLLSSLLWFAVVPLRHMLIFGMIFSVIFQELFRFLLYLILKKAEKGLKKICVTEKSIISQKYLLAYVCGLGFGLMSGTFAIINILANILGPGTFGLRGGSSYFFLTSALLTLAFILLNVTWSVIMHGLLDQHRYGMLILILFSHIIASCLTLLNQSQLYYITIPGVYFLLFLCTVVAFKMAGATCKSLYYAIFNRTTTIQF